MTHRKKEKNDRQGDRQKRTTDRKRENNDR